jgi:putative transposase
MTDQPARVTPLGAVSPEPASARQAVNEMVEAGLLDHLMDRVDQDGLRLTGQGGFLPELVKAVLERGLAAELTEHLGYEKGDPAGRGTPNSRNGTTPKTLATEVGDIGLAVPRDRAGTFEPRLVPKGARRAGGLDDMIISLYSGGMTVRDIQHHLVSTLGTELSHEAISNITDAVEGIRPDIWDDICTACHTGSESKIAPCREVNSYLVALIGRTACLPGRRSSTTRSQPAPPPIYGIGHDTINSWR